MNLRRTIVAMVVACMTGFGAVAHATTSLLESLGLAVQIPDDIGYREDCDCLCLHHSCVGGVSVSYPCCDPADYCGNVGVGMLASGGCYKSRCDTMGDVCASPMICLDGTCCVPAGASCTSSRNRYLRSGFPCCGEATCEGEIGEFRCCYADGLPCAAADECCSGKCDPQEHLCATRTPTATATPTPSGTETPTRTPTRPGDPFCGGDCDGESGITVEELTRAIRIALGDAAAEQCAAADADRDGEVGVADLVAAVRNALEGCFCGDGRLNRADEFCDGNAFRAPSPPNFVCRDDCRSACLPGACGAGGPGTGVFPCCNPRDYCVDRGAGMVALGVCFPRDCEDSPATCRSPTSCVGGTCCIPERTSCNSVTLLNQPSDLPCCGTSRCEQVDGAYVCCRPRGKHCTGGLQCCSGSCSAVSDSCE